MKQFVIASAFALTLTTALSAQQPTSTDIPDAPRPQMAIPAVTPGIGTPAASSSTPDAPAPQQTTTPNPPQKSAEPEADTETSAPVTSGAPLTTIRIQSNYVEVPFTVKDNHGGLVAGIDWREVRVYENGVRQKMAVFLVDPTPLSVALVIDQSLDFHTMARVNEAIAALPSAFANYDSVSVFTYNNGPQLRTDFTAGTSPRLAAVLEQSKAVGRDDPYYAPGEALGGPTGIQINGHANDNINPLASGGPGSPYGVASQQVPREPHTLNDAILMAAESLSHAAKGRRRIVYVISDGKEYGSKAKSKDVIKYLQTNNISVYATLAGDFHVAGLGWVDHIHIPLMVRDNILPVYTAATGGQTFAEFRTHGIETSFQKITEQARTQYGVGYYSHEPLTDGKFRTIEVRVLRPNLDVIAKKGYYPTPQSIMR